LTLMELLTQGLLLWDGGAYLGRIMNEWVSCGVNILFIQI
jgi:hypothetical protein